MIIFRFCKAFTEKGPLDEKSHLDEVRKRYKSESTVVLGARRVLSLRKLAAR